jgi:hypothetical protein
VLPALQIGWWNVDTGTRELTTLPGKNLAGGGMIPVLDNRTQSFFPAGSSAMFWGPLAAIFSMLALYWGWQWAKGWQLRRHRAGRRLALPIPGLAFVNNALGRVGAKFTDLRIGERVRYRLMRGIPKSLRVWFCVRCANAEEDPAAWCQHVKFMACRHLQMAEQATMPKIGEKIVSLHPRADEARVRALIRKLDSALYGSEELDFASWKRAFKREIRPTLLPRRRTGHDRTGGGLPELNPRKAA